MKYLVIECRELGDQWECDADRTPICITEDYSKYNKRGYEIYEILPDNTFKLVREYEDVTEKGFALYFWDMDEEVECNKPTIIKEYPNKKRNDFSKSFIKKLKAETKFEDTINEIYSDIQYDGSHAEEVDDKWLVFGEYYDDNYDRGY